MATHIPTPAAVPTLPPVSHVEPVPFSRSLKVEFRKSWDTRAGTWLLIAIGGLVLVAELIAALVTGFHNVDDVDLGTFATVAGFITQLLLPVLGILVVSTEWSQRTAMVTFALEPRRTRVVQAKLGVGLVWTAITVVFALAMGIIFNLLYGAIAGRIAWTGGGGIIGFVITQALAMILGFALAAFLLNTPAAIVVYFAYLFALPTLFAIGNALIGWFDSVSKWLDLSDAQQPLYDGLQHMSGGEWAHFVVSTLLWIGVPLAFGLRRILRAEVK